jgi:endonuclease/exonuclease/phosphatase (EEP) superfamily protein YafD
MTANLWLGNADAKAVMRVARANHVDVLSVQELRPKTLVRLDAAGADTYFPSRAIDPREGASGSGLLARRELHPTGAPDLATHAQPEAALEIPGAPAVTIKAVHPAPPVRPSADAPWKRAIAALPGSDSTGDVRILAGDFNATLDHPELRALLDRGYVDAADAAGIGLRPTWPALKRRALPLTIDHVLVDRRVRVEKVTIVQIPRTDHRAVIAVLRLPRR